MKEIAEKAAETGVKEVIELAAGYTKQMVEALTPVAKQAYEIGLVTLQIDAAQVLILSFMAVVVAILVVRKTMSEYRKGQALAALPENKEDYFKMDASYHMPALGVPYFMASGVSLLLAVFGLINLLSLWMWVQLMRPELWLAHKAVEKILR